MQRTLTQDEPQLAESFCLVCEACVQVSSGVDIFYTSLPRNGELLASCVLRVLRPVASDLRSSYICGRCHNLFQILEQAQWAVSNITSEILKVYHSRDSEKLTDQTIRLAEDDSAQHLFIPASIVDEKGGVNDNTLNEIASMSNEFFNPANNNEEAIEALNNERLSVVKLEEINETKTGVGQYKKQCGVCNRLFKSAKDLQMHLLKHGGSRPYKCQRCDERFSDFGVASNHAIEVHFSKINCIVVAKEPMPNEIFDFSGEDSIAPESSQESAIVDSNSGQIENEKKKRKKKCDDPAWSSRKELEHVCSICGKKWRTLTELKSHVKSHSELRPYMCEKCGQAYKHKGALEIHVGMHSGVSPFQCSVCSKCFTQKGALMRHLPMHTGETPYQCELCGKRFVHHTSYNMHSLSHTGKKSYQCHVSHVYVVVTDWKKGEILKSEISFVLNNIREF